MLQGEPTPKSQEAGKSKADFIVDFTNSPSDFPNFNIPITKENMNLNLFLSIKLANKILAGK